MTTPKFKTNDRVKWALGHTNESSGAGCIIVGKLDASYGWKYKVTNGGDLWWHESHLSLDVPAEPKFKIGDRVKWKDYEGNTRKGVIYNQLDHPVRYSMESDRCLYWHDLSLSLDVPEPSANSGLSNKLTELAIALVNSNLSLAHRAEAMDAIMNPKQFATANQVALAAEVIQQVFKIAALEKELREANDKIKRLKSLIGEM